MLLFALLFMMLIEFDVVKCDLVNETTETTTMTRIVEQSTYYRGFVGENIVLPCEIENKRNATVVWQYSRKRIPETLLIGMINFKKDYRIRIITNASLGNDDNRRQVDAANEKREGEQEEEDESRREAWNLEIRRLRFDDEGFYHCRVMAKEPLKRVIYLKVEVNLTMTLQNSRPSLSFDSNLSITCNTSLTLAHLINRHQPKQSLKNLKNNNFRFEWLRNMREFQSPYFGHDVEFMMSTRTKLIGDNPSLVDINNLIYLYDNDTVLNANAISFRNYRIEYLLRPTIATRLHIMDLSEQNIGNYTCRFRGQNVTINIFMAGI